MLLLGLGAPMVVVTVNYMFSILLSKLLAFTRPSFPLKYSIFIFLPLCHYINHETIIKVNFN
jgi:hypothetical protein